MGVIHYILDNASRFPDKDAIVFDQDVLTYGQCVERVRKVSGAFSKLGIGSGTHVGLVANNSLEFVVSMLAIADLGATVVPMYTTISEKALIAAIKATDISYIVGIKNILQRAFVVSEDSNGSFPVPREKCVVVDGKLNGCHSLEEIQQRVSDTYVLGAEAFNEEQDFILTMTSGSTSEPKPIVFTQGTKIRRCFNAKEVYGLSDSDTVLVATPLYHSISQRLVLTPLILGGTCVIMRKFSPQNWLNQVSAKGVTFTIAVASQLEALLGHVKNFEGDISSLRSVVSCCALISDEIKKQLLDELECEFHECYGASEVGIISNLSDEDPIEKIHTVGRAVPSVEIKIVDEKRKPLGAGIVGEIACQSGMCFSRYYKNEEATCESLSHGYFYTGDMGYLDDDGFLIFSGRLKEIIITGGTNVFPKDVESVLNAHPKVKESAVVGITDKQFGEAVLALVIKESGVSVSERDLRSHCRHRLADVQKPMGYIFLEDFPRTALGKTLKYKLARQYANYDLTAGLRAIMGKAD